MPSRHGFALSVVDAVSRRPLAERTGPDGKTWVKGESGEEFFVVVKSARHEQVRCCIKVDGQHMGYSFVTDRPTESPAFGPIVERKPHEQVEEGTAATVAFRFTVSKVETATPDDAEADAPPTSGTVQATWYSVVATGAAATQYAPVATWHDGAGATVRSDNKKEASALRASAGTTPSSLRNFARATYTTVDELCRLTIHYTSDFGLAVRGLLTQEERDAMRAPPTARKRPRRDGGGGGEAEACPVKSETKQGGGSSDDPIALE
jgi:hypothetical protein